ncbi:unnamed protein product, partial [Rotaria sp. Silwood2]
MIDNKEETQLRKDFVESSSFDSLPIKKNGRSGTAITFVTQYDVKLMHKIEDRINKPLI